MKYPIRSFELIKRSVGFALLGFFFAFAGWLRDANAFGRSGYTSVLDLFRPIAPIMFIVCMGLTMLYLQRLYSAGPVVVTDTDISIPVGNGGPFELRWQDVSNVRLTAAGRRRRIAFETWGRVHKLNLALIADPEALWSDVQRRWRSAH